MNIYIVGAGAVGRWFGDGLQQIGCEVAFAPRSLEAVMPTKADLAIIAVKAFDTPSAILTLKRALGTTNVTTILCVQNGIGNEELLAAAFGADAVVAGALTVPVEKRADGNSVAANRGGLGIAPMGKQAHNWLSAMLRRLQLPLVVAHDYRALKWSKLALNIIANATAAILDMTPEMIVRDPRLFRLELQALREMRAVMQAQKIAQVDLPRYPVRALLAGTWLPDVLARRILAPRIARARGPKLPSLLLDLREGKSSSEIGSLNGAIARVASECSVAAPVNLRITEILERIVAAPQQWERYRGRPDALLAEIL